MPFCENCYAEIKIGERTCPQCRTQQKLWWEECGFKGIFEETPSRTTITPKAESFTLLNKPEPKQAVPVSDELTVVPDDINDFSDQIPEDPDLQVNRLMARALERYEAGRAWLGSKDRKKARREFQKAFNCYGEVLKIDPNNMEAREFRARCLQKIC
jgi:hypothetical protein